MKASFARLLDHAHWANARTLASLQTGDPPAHAVRLFAHVLTTEKIYHGRISGLDPWPQDAFSSPDRVAHDRKNLTVKRSTDDCETWTASRVIEPGQSSYSDMAQNQDDLVCCIYEDQMIDRQNDTKYVSVSRFDVDWILGG